MSQGKTRESRPRGELDALLTSSKPLEYAVGRQIEEIGLTANGSYWYERDGKSCETDHLATFFEPHDYFSVRQYFFIECEYRDPSKKWVFYPATRTVVDTSEISILDGFVRTRSGRPFSLIGLRHDNLLNLSRVGPGIEIYEDHKGNWNQNPQSIENAIRQAILPACHHLSRAVHHALLLQNPVTIALYHPVIVTTASLHVLKGELSAKGLDKLADVGEAFDKVPAVLSCFNTPEYASSLAKQRLLSLLDELKPELETADGVYLVGGYGTEPEPLRRQDILRLSFEAVPTRALIVQFDHLEPTLSAYVNSVRRRTSEEFQRYTSVGPL